MSWRYLCYGVALALGAFVLEWMEYRYVTHAFSTELYIILIAAGFLALGAMLGARLTRTQSDAPFERNEAALRALGVTPREYAVLELLAEGQSNKEMARALGVSPNTVKTHLSKLFAKLEAKRRGEAVNLARALKLIA
ncbi:MAG: LuxR C-terminal-related transcriptional regulator [Pseudomonadota bacterium]